MERKIATPAGTVSNPRPWTERSEGSGSELPQKAQPVAK